MTIRVLLDAATAMERSALQCALAGCEDIELVQAPAPDAPRPEVDVVVLNEAALCDFPPSLQAIVDVARIGVVAIAEDGAAGNLYRVDRRGWRFAAGGRHGLADAIRAVAMAN